VLKLDWRPGVRGRSAESHLGCAFRLGVAGMLLLLAAAAGCGQNAGLPRLASSGATTSAASSVPGGSTPPTTTSPPAGTGTLLTPGPHCPLSAATVSSVVGVHLYEEPADPPGSCSFDSVPGGQGLQSSEIRVNIQTGDDDLISLYGFFVRESAQGMPGCEPFRVDRRPDLGPDAFETACGATATLGPSSADDYLPTNGSGQLTITVNRGLAVSDHRVATCLAETATILRLVRAAW
jgi:hypothetical protein